MRMIYGIATMVFSLLYTSVSSAEQLAFKVQQTTSGQQFEYRWQDIAQQNHALSFTLPLNSTSHLPLQLNHYQPELAQRYVTVHMLKAARNVDPRQARIDIRQRREEIEVKIAARDEIQAKQIEQELHSVREQAFDDYLSQQYYVRYTTPLNQRAVKPDHVRFISQSTNALIPLSQAFYEKLARQSDARQYFNLVLGWVQSIPYDPLNDRLTSHGSGFLPPLALLMQNQGDCDSKSVLTASIGRAFLPDTPMVLVLLRDHALLGIGLPAQAGDDTIEWQGSRYVLLEPTGPALLPFGQIGEDSRNKLASGQYTVEAIPAKQ